MKTREQLVEKLAWDVFGQTDLGKICNLYGISIYPVIESIRDWLIERSGDIHTASLGIEGGSIKPGEQINRSYNHKPVVNRW